ncbi:MAG: hypothetical protein PHW24_01995 [Candidatus Moranbacteria bacterium]|nr:hypothetical protein [Candidatus Moranbacteria bacterium]
MAREEKGMIGPHSIGDVVKNKLKSFQPPAGPEEMRQWMLEHRSVPHPELSFNGTADE